MSSTSEMTAEKRNIGIVKLVLVWFAGPIIPLTLTIAGFPYIGTFCTFFGGTLVGLVTTRLYHRWLYSGVNGAVFSGFVLSLNYLLRRTIVGRFSLTHAFFEPQWVSIVWLLLAGFMGGFTGFGANQLFSEQLDKIGITIQNLKRKLKGENKLRS